MKITAYNYINTGNTKFKRDKLFVCPGCLCIEEFHSLENICVTKLLNTEHKHNENTIVLEISINFFKSYNIPNHLKGLNDNEVAASKKRYNYSSINAKRNEF